VHLRNYDPRQRSVDRLRGGQEMGDSTEDRDAIPIEGSSAVPVGPGHGTSFDRTHLDFGHYAGRSIEELAELDPDYLRWLARHPSGARFRAEIERVLGRLPMLPG
jgi:hypothetical protein